MIRTPSRRRLGAPLAALVLAAAASVGLLAAGPVGAADVGPVDPSISDGDPGSLRDALETANDDDVIILVAGATYQLTNCDLDEIDITSDVTIQGNGATIEQTCDGARVLSTWDADLVVEATTLTGGSTYDDGGAVDVQGEGDADLTLVDSTIVGNWACNEGGGISQDTGGTVTVIRSTLSGNESDQDAAIDLDGEGTLLMVNSTVTDNTSSEDGAISAEGSASATIVYSTIARNTHDAGAACIDAAAADDADSEVDATADGEPANLQVETEESATLAVFGTVIAEPLGDAPNCSDGNQAPLTGTTSSGYNFSDDASCGLDATTDTQDGGAPGLGALAANGGPTLTMLPVATSPLVNAIPLASCGDGDALVGGWAPITTDQRGVTRPQETGCEIGSVEIEAPEPVVIEPTFTG